MGAVGLNGSRLQNARVLSFTSSGLFIFGSSLSIWLEISSTLKPHDIPGYFHGYKQFVNREEMLEIWPDKDLFPIRRSNNFVSRFSLKEVRQAFSLCTIKTNCTNSYSTHLIHWPGQSSMASLGSSWRFPSIWAHCHSARIPRVRFVGPDTLCHLVSGMKT